MNVLPALVEVLAFEDGDIVLSVTPLGDVILDAEQAAGLRDGLTAAIAAVSNLHNAPEELQ